MEVNSAATEAEAVSNLFGLYKAEWLHNQLFELFTEPSYFAELANDNTCVLLGGRGTGKTTVLRGMSYEGQFALNSGSTPPLKHVPYVGLYYRVDTRRVTAFRGPEIDEDSWTKCFGHYINLVFCSLIVEFLQWYGRTASNALELDVEALERVAASLNLETTTTLADLSRTIKKTKIQFEASINNVADAARPPLSLLGAPVEELVAAAATVPALAQKRFFFILDEYENFLPYQQRVVNTLIKHASAFVFKIGVRELGWRERGTLNPNERLTHPGDYARIDLREQLTGDTFRQFASKVCNGRLGKVRLIHSDVIERIEEALPGMSEEEEAVRLGVETENRQVLASISNAALQEFGERLTPARLYFTRYWSAAGHGSVEELLADWMRNESQWETRFGNYLHASLFAIRRGKRGIRKYYAGWEVFTNIADGNIRYLLELVHQSFRGHALAGRDVATPVDAELQTRAAQDVARKNLDDLEGLSVEGARLTRLLLGLGRFFNVLAATPEGHTPELNQFEVAEEDDDPELSRACQLLDLAVMHQALVRFRGTKPADNTDTKDYDYMIHPIFTPFFVISYRRKRKTIMTARELLLLTEQPKEAIRELLAKQNRIGDYDLPDQMNLFGGYFGVG